MELLFQRDRDRQTLLALVELSRRKWSPAGRNDNRKPPRAAVYRLVHLGFARSYPRQDSREYAATLTESGERMARVVVNLFDGDTKGQPV